MVFVLSYLQNFAGFKQIRNHTHFKVLAPEQSHIFFKAELACGGYAAPRSIKRNVGFFIRRFREIFHIFNRGVILLRALGIHKLANCSCKIKIIDYSVSHNFIAPSKELCTTGNKV